MSAATVKRKRARPVPSQLVAIGPRLLEIADELYKLVHAAADAGAIEADVDEWERWEEGMERACAELRRLVAGRAAEATEQHRRLADLRREWPLAALALSDLVGRLTEGAIAQNADCCNSGEVRGHGSRLPKPKPRTRRRS